jgi:16S rRNA (guanine527-N7)-methyltransferase
MNVRTLDLTLAQVAFAAHQEAFQTFAELLTEHNRTTNLTRIETPEDIRNRHFLDSLTGLAVLDEAAADSETRFSIIDVGSGAGFPGLAIAIARPQWTIVSLEATDKKVRFQRLVCQTLGLNNVDIRHGRAEVIAHESEFRERFDAAVARAVAGLNILAELTMAFVRLGGQGLFWKGPQVQDEIAVSLSAFEHMGATPSRLYSYCLTDSSSKLYLAAAEKNIFSPFNRPRQNYAVIKKRPL